MRASNVIAAIASADLKTLDRGPKMSRVFGRVDYHDSTKGGFAKSGFAKHMNLDWQICSRARLSRDARFDGKFFIGVIGSGVYCRPICPAPTAKEKNVRYFPTAAAAAEAGFRPCLRCRPKAPARNSGMAGNFKHGFASFATDRRERVGGWRGRSSCGTSGSGVTPPPPPVPATPGSDASCCGSDSPSSLCEEAHRRNQPADGSNCPRFRFRMCKTIQCQRPQRLSSNPDSNSESGATNCRPSQEINTASALFSAHLIIGRVCWRFWPLAPRLASR